MGRVFSSLSEWVPGVVTLAGNDVLVGTAVRFMVTLPDGVVTLGDMIGTLVTLC